MKKNKNTYFEYFLTFLLLAVSGGEFFCIFYGRYFIPIFLFSSFVYFYRTYHKIKIFNSFGYILFGSVFMGIHYFGIYSEHVKNTYFPGLLMLLGSYFFFSSIRYSRFKLLYLNTLTVMAVVSIIIFLLVETGLVTPSFYEKEGKTAVMFLMHNMGRLGSFGRMAGIYWEPGAYQIVLNLAFILFSDEIVKRNIKGPLRIKLIIIGIAVLLTNSTAGYLMLSLLVGYLGWGNLKYDGVSWKTMVFVFIGTFFIYYIFKSDTIQNKIGKEGQESSVSYNNRKSDNLGMLQMISEQPLLGYGLDSSNYSTRSFQVGNRTSSNGPLHIMACLGIPFFIFYLSFLIFGIRRVFRKNTLMILSLFLFINAFEVFWFYPLAFVFHFLRGDNQISKQEIAYNETNINNNNKFQRLRRA